MNDAERTVWKAVELRVLDDGLGGRPKIMGLAVPYEALSDTIGFDTQYREKFERGAFSGSLRSAKGLVNVEHDRGTKLGRFKDNAKVWDDDKGVYIEVTVPNTRAGNDAVEEVRAGILDGMSIEFRLEKPEDAVWRRKDGQLIRSISKATLLGVALTSYPAYPQTAGTVALRSLEEFRTAEEEAAKAAAAAEAEAKLKAEEAALAENDLLRRRLDLASAS